ncbi:MAG: 50S ribosomal protein L6 [Sphaerochaetaceae bacterium]|nr:50S ribosomal protein L6 [Sphaerochaetaceae bacterium]
MSRIGKLPVVIPAGVKVTVKDNLVLVEGPKGKLEQAISPAVTVEVKDNEVLVTRKDDEKESRSAHGLYRQLINNMIIGVSQGYTKTLLINGVGYRAEFKKDGQKNIIVLSLGYSTIIDYVVPEGITATGEGTKIVLTGIDKALVGQAAAEIRSLRGPEPYKGKGIKYETENIRRKVGKSGGKK